MRETRNKKNERKANRNKLEIGHDQSRIKIKYYYAIGQSNQLSP